jgi:hypothetical protein
LGLEVGGDREEVLDDRGGEHRREQWAAVGVETEQHDVAMRHGAQQVDLVTGRLVAVQEPRDV